MSHCANCLIITIKCLGMMNVYLKVVYLCLFLLGMSRLCMKTVGECLIGLY